MPRNAHCENEPCPKKTIRIQVLSDLHLDHGNPVPALAADAEVLIVASDLAPAKQPWVLGDAVDEWLAAEHTLYVPGNHEFYGSDIDEARQTLTEQWRMHGVTLLDPAAITIEYASSERRCGPTSASTASPQRRSLRSSCCPAGSITSTMDSRLFGG